ncbi:helix-hairpin-helix domain-containing protein [Bacillus sp. CGMCC 1.16607]|uniref:helix-hairpin-helix domain-containing protein n=1 Tax=Bacillus sp. CGMCC 1.16607 TaxID=3351842 RepID=UPI003638F58F
MKDWLIVHKIKIFGGIILVIISFYFYLTGGDDKDGLMIEEISSSKNDQLEVESTVTKVPEEPVNIMVDVKGAVIQPGVYHAIQGERVIDLIHKAGGFTKNADQNQVNLSEHIEDEMVIFVPILGDAGGVSQEMGSSGKSTLININKASDSELQNLPGIGPSKAIAIIEYRETNGGFKKIEDLKKISGIGEKTFEKLAPLITVK